MADVAALRRTVLEILPRVDLVIGWQRGPDALRAAPLLMRNAADVDRLIWDRTCVHNLATFLPREKGKKVAIIVKGCDSRSVIQLVQEGLVDREDLTVIGLPCDGVVSQAKLRRAADMDRLESAEIGADHVEITAAGKTLRMALDAVMPDKCLSCAYPNALLFDRFVGDPMEPPQQRQDPYARLDAFEALPLEERFDFWKREMSRCIRCYACRNACPLCVCRDYCLAESRQPHYQSQESDVREKWFFQLIHATHLAGRCTECGECERACPMGIPVLLFKKKLGRIMTELFQYEAGLDVSATAPLLTFQAEEENIVEKQWL